MATKKNVKTEPVKVEPKSKIVNIDTTHTTVRENG